MQGKQQKQLPPTFLPPGITDPAPFRDLLQPNMQRASERASQEPGNSVHQASTLIKFSGQIHTIQNSECCLSRSQPHLAKPDSANLNLTAFGQTELDHDHNWPTLFDRIWLTLCDHIWPIFVNRIWPDQIWPNCVSGSGGGKGERREGPEGWEAKNFAPFFSGPPGLHMTARELQTCTFEGPGLRKHHQNSSRRPLHEKKNDMGAVEGEKKARNFGRSGAGGGVRCRVHNNHNHNRNNNHNYNTSKC